MKRIKKEDDSKESNYDSMKDEENRTEGNETRSEQGTSHNERKRSS